MLLVAGMGMAAEGEGDGGAGGGKFSTSLHAGAFNGNGNRQLTGQGDGYALALAGRYRLAEHLAVGLDLVGYAQHFDSGMEGSSLFVAVSDRMDVSTSAFSGELLYVAQAEHAGAYAGGGLGYYRTRMSVDVIGLGLFDVGDAVERTDSTLGVHLVAGVGLGSRQGPRLDLQYRRTFAEAEFGAPFGRVDVGGELLMAGLQWRFE